MLFQNDKWHIFWLVTVIFLTAGVLGWNTGFLLAIGISAVNLALSFAEEKKLSAFAVQVRLTYLVLLGIFYWEPLQALYLIPVAGTWAVVFTGYCPLARMLSLLPWNRREPMSAALFKRTFFSPPVKGSILPGK